MDKNNMLTVTHMQVIQLLVSRRFLWFLTRWDRRIQSWCKTNCWNTKMMVKMLLTLGLELELELELESKLLILQECPIKLREKRKLVSPIKESTHELGCLKIFERRVDGDLNDIVISSNHGKSFLNKEHGVKTLPLGTAPLKRSK
ncbi:unnamed protein product [Brassica oleracea var. botrytis]|uniref:(rape) hypothetical protein n=1 Tax=Brassica napus TaxID=3708 RepID=A0A816JS18_BRANA|nr:unnamed protein product [Brassica napus]